MKIYIGDKEYEFSDDDLEIMCIGEGVESVVYRHGMHALKIYKECCYKQRLSEEDVFKLSNISTQRILLPRDPIYVDEPTNFRGYTTYPFIYEWSKFKIRNMSMLSLLNEIDLFKEDAMILSNSGFEIADFYLYNMIYNGKLYMVDPGSFMESCDSPEEIFRNNIISINDFVKDELFSLIKVRKKERAKMNYYFEQFDYIGDAIRNSCSYCETVSSYVKKLSMRVG